MPPGPWNDATDRQLLLVMIHLTAPKLPSWDKVAELMGEGFTAAAVRQHFQKLRKDSKAEFGELDVEAKSTPSKSKAPATNGKIPNKSGGKRKARAEIEDGEDDSEVGSPSKKAVKKEKKKKEELD